MEDPQDRQTKKLTFENLKMVEKIVKASISSAEILIDELSDSEQINREIYQEIANVFKRIRHLVGDSNYNQLTGVQKCIDQKVAEMTQDYERREESKRTPDP